MDAPPSTPGQSNPVKVVGPPQRPARSRVWLWASLGAFAVLLLLFGLPLASYFWVHHRVHGALEGELARIRAEGYPASLSEINGWYASPPGHNVADDYLAAFKLIAPQSQDDLKALDRVDRRALLPDQSLTPAEKTLMAAWTGASRAAIERLVAAPAGEARYPGDYTQGSQTLLPHLGQARKAAQLLRDDAILLADQGDGDAAAARVLATFRMAHSLSREPTMIGGLVALSIHVLIAETLEQVLARSRPGAQALTRLTQALAAAEEDESSPLVWAGQRAMETEIFDELAGRPTPQGPGTAGVRPWLVLVDQDELGALLTYRKVIEDVRLPGPARRAHMQAAIEEARAGLTNLGSRMILPGLTAPLQTFLEGTTTLRLARTAVACRLFAIAHGRLPDRLEECVPEFLDAVPKCAQTDKPLRMKHQATGLLLWGAGYDNIDHGGVVLDARGERMPRGADMTFILVEPGAMPAQTRASSEPATPG